MNTLYKSNAERLGHLLDSRNEVEKKILDLTSEIANLRKHNQFYPVGSQTGLLTGQRKKLKRIDALIIEEPMWLASQIKESDDRILQVRWEQWKDNQHIKQTQRNAKQRLILRQNNLKERALPLC